jgi:glycerol-3-phosphate acyltransferase PlsX
MPKIALDAMGSDRAPAPEVEGAVQAVEQGLADVVLVGDEARLRTEIERLTKKRPRGLSVVHASQVIGMGDSPSQAARTKTDSSMRKSFEMVKNGEVGGVVSAGNSGAVMACSLFVLKRAKSVDRPGIITTFPTPHGACSLIDMGANIDCKPQNLAQFAVMGAVYARLRHHKRKPRVGLLSNGEESSKGTALVRQAHALLAEVQSDELEYVGFVEGNDIFAGKADVVVTDGFTGNVVLKTTEGVASAIAGFLREEMRSTVFAKTGAIFSRRAFQRLKRKMDYEEYGGAPLIGVNGVVVLGHGRSSAKAIKNALAVAAGFAGANLPDAVTAALGRCEPMWEKSA